MARAAVEDGPHPVDLYVGRRVVEQRLSRGFSQSQLAAALGLTFQQVQKYEKGANRISSSKLYDIASFLGVDVGYFFAGFEKVSADPATGDDRSDRIEPTPTRYSVEIAQIAPRLTVTQQKLALELMRQMTEGGA